MLGGIFRRRGMAKLDYPATVEDQINERTKVLNVNTKQEVVIVYSKEGPTFFQAPFSGRGPLGIYVLPGTKPTSFFFVVPESDPAKDLVQGIDNSPVIHEPGLPAVYSPVLVEYLKHGVRTVVVQCYEGIFPKDVVERHPPYQTTFLATHYLQLHFCD